MGGYTTMAHDNVHALENHLAGAIDDPLTEILRSKARDLLAIALEMEAQAFIDQYKALRLPDGRQRVVRNGYLPEREVMTGIGPVKVQGVRVRDRGEGESVAFSSKILPPYLRKSRSIEALLPWLYLKGVSTGDFNEALQALLGPSAEGLSASTISRLKGSWEEEYRHWRQRRFDQKKKTYVYFWVDGIYCKVRSDGEKQCLLVIIGATKDGKKELVAIEDGYRESPESWKSLLLDLKERGLTTPPKLAVGDGALGFWQALYEVYGETRQQRCWVHKTRNVLDKLPKSLQAQAKAHLHDIWMAPTKKEANKAFDFFLAFYEAKYPKATACLQKDRDELLAFYDFPAEHWVHLRTTNPIESTSATVRLRTAKTRNCVSRTTILTMVFKLCQSAQKKWRVLNGAKHLEQVYNNIVYLDGVHPESYHEEKHASRIAA
jgi:transposase-like protein